METDLDWGQWERYLAQFSVLHVAAYAVVGSGGSSSRTSCPRRIWLPSTSSSRTGSRCGRCSSKDFAVSCSRAGSTHSTGSSLPPIRVGGCCSSLSGVDGHRVDRSVARLRRGRHLHRNHSSGAPLLPHSERHPVRTPIGWAPVDGPAPTGRDVPTRVAPRGFHPSGRSSSGHISLASRSCTSVRISWPVSHSGSFTTTARSSPVGCVRSVATAGPPPHPVCHPLPGRPRCASGRLALPALWLVLRS
jgi:hypothetical protein